MQTTASVGLLEREAEIAQLRALLDETSEGDGRFAVIEGPGGIGKTRLLETARERAGERGIEVLAARGSELEQDFPFGIVRQLFEPLLRRASRSEQKKLLQGPAQLAAPALGLGEPQTREEPPKPTVPQADPVFPILHGLYWLTSNICERSPLLLALDDAHWSDASSLRFVSFLLPRLEELPLLLALTFRPEEVSDEAGLLSGLASDRLARVLRPAPLSEGAVEELVREQLATTPEAQFTRACHEATGGNPFLVLELLKELADEKVRPTAEAARGVRGVAPSAVARAALVRLARLGDHARKLAHAVAVLGERSLLRIASTLAGLDRREASEAADTLAQAGILAPGRPLAFAHPILRTAVYTDIKPAEKAAAHEQAARLLAGEAAGPEEVAIHLLATDPGSDHWVVDALRDAARPALSRGAPDTAVRYLRRALEEPPPPEIRPDLLRELGSALTGAGEPAPAVEAFEQALSLRDDPKVLASVAPELALVLWGTGRPEEGLELLDRAADAVSETDRELALQLEAVRLHTERLMTAWGPGTAIRSQAEARLARFGPIDGNSPAERLCLATLTGIVWWDGGPAAEVARLAERAFRGGRLVEEYGADTTAFVGAVLGTLFAEQVDAAEAFIERALEDARARGSAWGFIQMTALRSRLAYVRGSILNAEADARSAVDTVRLHGWAFGLAWALPYLLDVLIERDELETAERELDEAGWKGDIPDETPLFAWLLRSRARLRIAQGDLEHGVEELLELRRRLQRWGVIDPAGLTVAPSAAPALVALERKDEARRLADEAVELARGWGAPGAIGMALCARGHAEGGHEGLELHHQAVESLQASPFRLEHAHALVDLGAALRRARRRSQARAPLRDGLRLSQRCGATRLAKYAHAELLATGERLHPLTATGPESLTPSERRVADMAAEGMTNRDIAQALFLSLRTVEMHLTHAYRKLDISSREELAGMLRV